MPERSVIDPGICCEAAEVFKDNRSSIEALTDGSMEDCAGWLLR